MFVCFFSLLETLFPVYNFLPPEGTVLICPFSLFFSCSVCPSQVMDLCWTSINVTAKAAFIIRAELQSMALKVSCMLKLYVLVYVYWF